jgi:hypothetical protein
MNAPIPADIKELLRTTPIEPSEVSEPLSVSGLPSFKLVFPEETRGRARIRFSGLRLIDWEGEEWVSYERDGTQWYRDSMTEKDAAVLYAILGSKLGFKDDARGES